MTAPGAGHGPVARTITAGEGPPVVLVPGGLTGWLAWEAHAERLARRRRVVRSQLLSVDLGLERRPLPPDYSLRTETLALAGALDDLALDRADLVGWSYGGAVALDLALNDPDRIRTLTLVEPAAAWVLRRSDLVGPDAAAFEADMATFGPDEVSEDQLARFVVAAGLVDAGTDPRTAPRWPLWLRHKDSLRVGDVPSRHEDRLERLHRFTRPVLLFVGEGTPSYERDTVAALGRELPHARVEELPGAHALPLVSFEPFLAILEAFLDEPRV